MHTLKTALNYINDLIYESNNLTISEVIEEEQNSEYAAGQFKLFSTTTNKTVRFRVAKVTPNKVGQFVTFWEKDDKGINQPFQYDEAPELLVITTFKNERHFGQFIFPKDILLKKGILKSDLIKGKMGMRVYPSWDLPTNKTAIHTQHWQLEYFFEVNQEEALSMQKILALYNQ